MQTFLPLPSFVKSAKVLDYRRLGKQRVEAKQILQANLKEGSTSWRNHPATLMWKDDLQALAHYGLAMCREWIARGYKDTTSSYFVSHIFGPLTDDLLPWWFGMEDFHASHRAALLFKDQQYYGQFGWQETPELKYVWPTKEK